MSFFQKIVIAVLVFSAQKKLWQNGKMEFPGFLDMYEGKGEKIKLPEVM
jgi:hypothetical protein